MKYLITLIIFLSFIFIGCGTDQNVIRVIEVSEDQPMDLMGLDQTDRAKLEEIKKNEEKKDSRIDAVIKKTPNYSIEEYLLNYPQSNNPTSQNYTVGGYDIISIKVYEEPDLTRDNVSISADGYISFPLIGQIKVLNLTTSEIEQLISNKLAQGQYLLNAHISVNVEKFQSKQYMILGSVRKPGAYSLHAHERLLDGLSQAGGIESQKTGNTGMIIRTLNPGTALEKKIVIRFGLNSLLKEGDQLSNLILQDKDLIYIPVAEHFYIIGEIKSPGAYTYLGDDITILEAISNAGGFTKIAARNKTRIVRIENGIEKIIEIKVDKITKDGQKGQDVLIQPGDVIVVPESLF